MILCEADRKKAFEAFKAIADTARDEGRYLRPDEDATLYRLSAELGAYEDALAYDKAMSEMERCGESRVIPRIETVHACLAG